MKAFILATIFFGLLSTQAEARHRHIQTGLDPSCNVTMPCLPSMSAAAVRESERVARGGYVARQMGIGGVAPRRQIVHRHRKEAIHHRGFTAPSQHNARRQPHEQQAAATRAEIVAHPAGCPRTAFCGCGAAVKVFGSPVRNLWLAANWFKFPRATPAPGMVAVRQHHVMVLQAHLGGGVWEVYDANSGRHMTRIHARSIAGYAIVNPRG